MGRIKTAVAGLAALAMLAGAPPTQHHHQIELAVGDSAEVTGYHMAGANVHNYGFTPPSLPRPSRVPESCDGAPNHTCETIFVTLERGDLSVEVVPQVAASDFGLFVFEADAEGNHGEVLAWSDQRPLFESTDGVEAASIAADDLPDSGHLVIWVIHWSTVGNYTLTATLS